MIARVSQLPPRLDDRPAIGITVDASQTVQDLKDVDAGTVVVALADPDVGAVSSYNCQTICLDDVLSNAQRLCT